MPITSSVDVKQYSIPIELGGTGANSRQEAVQNLGVYTTEDINQPLGVISLDENREPSPELMDEVIPVVIVALVGPKYLTLDQEGKYTIVNYDSFTKYSLSAISGSVERNGKVITYTAPTNVGKAGFIINGNKIIIDILETYLLPPKITFPKDTAINVPSVVRVTVSDFEVLGGTDTHSSTDWEVATDALMNNVIYRSMDDTVNLTDIELNMKTNTTLYVRARFHGEAMGPSRWSDILRFKTSNLRYNQTQSVFPSDNEQYGTNDILFGDGLAVTKNGQYIFVGADGVNSYNLDFVGQVVIYKQVNGRFERIGYLDIQTPIATARFGFSIAVSDYADRVFVSAIRDKVGNVGGAGSVTVFKKTGTDTWAYEERLVATDPENMASLGSSICCNGDGSVLIAGSPSFDVSDIELKYGRIHVFERVGLTWTEEFTDVAFTAGSLLGTSVATNHDGSVIIAGAPGDRSVYFYQKKQNNWIFARKEEHAAIKDYGHTVALAANERYYAVGGMNNGGTENDRGVIKVSSYKYDNVGTLYFVDAVVQTIIPTDVQPGDMFSASISFSDDGTILIVGSSMDDIGNSVNGGSVYVYELAVASDSGFVLKEKRFSNSMQSGARFGQRNALSGDAKILAVASPYFDLNSQTRVGVVNIFR